MDYEKKYKEALERATKAKNNASLSNGTLRVLGIIFPELKESEDERIRKALIQGFNECLDSSSHYPKNAQKYWHGIAIEDILAWLDKPQKTLSEMLEEYFANTPKEQLDKNWEELKHLNNIGPIIETGNKPKFKVGDWIVNNNSRGVCQVTEVRDDEYCLWPLDAEIMGYLSIIDVDDDYHLWTIQDAKDGDVLCYKDDEVEWILIYKNIIPTKSYNVPHDILKYYALFTGTDFYDSGIAGMIGENYASCFTPATKEQHDILEKAMTASGYEWDEDKKELRKIKKQGESIKIKKGKNYLCTKTHKYAGVEWIEGVKYYSSEDYSLVNQGCTCYCPKYSKEEHNNFFKEVEYDGCLEKQCEQKPVDKVEPKFKVGDWCIDNEDGVIFQIVKVLDNTYIYKTTEGSEYSCTHYSLENDAKLYTIQDAKDGDVLCYKDEIFIYKHDIKNCTEKETSFGGMVYYCCYDGKRYITDSMYSLTEKDKDDIHPATKEQREILFQKMKENGYEWDAENK